MQPDLPLDPLQVSEMARLKHNVLEAKSHASLMKDKACETRREADEVRPLPIVPTSAALDFLLLYFLISVYPVLNTHTVYFHAAARFCADVSRGAL